MPVYPWIMMVMAISYLKVLLKDRNLPHFLFLKISLFCYNSSFTRMLPPFTQFSMWTCLHLSCSFHVPHVSNTNIKARCILLIIFYCYNSTKFLETIGILYCVHIMHSEFSHLLSNSSSNAFVQANIKSCWESCFLTHCMIPSSAQPSCDCLFFQWLKWIFKPQIILDYL